MKIKRFALVFLLSFALLFVPFSVGYAQSNPSIICKLGAGATVSGLTDYLSCVLGSSIVGIIFALAFVYFFYGVAQYVLYPDGENKSKAKDIMINGIIALTIMFSIYGLIRLTRGTFGLVEDQNSVKIPKLPTQ